MARPLIGITTYVTPAKWSYWDLEAALIPADYVRAVERAGGRALLVPPASDGVDETLDALDGVIFSGGSDLDPQTYGAEAHPETTGVVSATLEHPLALVGGHDLVEEPLLRARVVHVVVDDVVAERGARDGAVLQRGDRVA